jgi:hypothetical protein
MRAMFQNAATMDLTMDILSEDIASSFNIAGPTTFHLPPSLQPSSTQKQIIHHPWIDLLPVQSFRNSLIVRMAEYDDEELCGDLYGLSSSTGKVGLIVWGESSIRGSGEEMELDVEGFSRAPYIYELLEAEARREAIEVLRATRSLHT